MTALGRAEEAIKVLECLSAANKKPAGYFVNLSLAQIKQSDHRDAASTALDGLRLYRDDQDLIGNLLTAQTAMGAFGKAAETAKIRLSTSEMSTPCTKWQLCTASTLKASANSTGRWP